VEITIINSAGQHKAHAIVVDDMDVDFRLPNDIKRDAKTVDGSAFVGINAVHSKDTMRLDVQSIMNLHPFIEQPSRCWAIWSKKAHSCAMRLNRGAKLKRWHASNAPRWMI
jgi:hypothetical protein